MRVLHCSRQRVLKEIFLSSLVDTVGYSTQTSCLLQILLKPLHVKCPLLKSVSNKAKIVKTYGQKINHDYLSWQCIKPLFYLCVLDRGKNEQLLHLSCAC